MGGEGYSDQAEWTDLFNQVFTVSRFKTMNGNVAKKINTFSTGKPLENVDNVYTQTAKIISDDMITTYAIFLKELAMESPPEFIHYKLPHFTPDHLEMIAIMKSIKQSVGKVVF